jgi:hypothetical protein
MELEKLAAAVRLAARWQVRWTCRRAVGRCPGLPRGWADKAIEAVMNRLDQ